MDAAAAELRAFVRSASLRAHPVGVRYSHRNDKEGAGEVEGMASSQEEAGEEEGEGDEEAGEGEGDEEAGEGEGEKVEEEVEGRLTYIPSRQELIDADRMDLVHALGVWGAPALAKKCRLRERRPGFVKGKVTFEAVGEALAALKAGGLPGPGSSVAEVMAELARRGLVVSRSHLYTCFSKWVEEGRLDRVRRGAYVRRG